MGCDWGQGGNLNDNVNGKFRARTEQEALFVPDAGGVICDVRFQFETQMGGIEGEWGYDDHFMLLLNNRILVASQASLMSSLTPIENTYEYSWSDIKNEDLDFSADLFYFGGASEIILPEPQEYVQDYAYMIIGSNALDPHRLNAISQNEISLGLVTFGDNDNTDCYHAGFQTDIEVDIGL